MGYVFVILNVNIKPVLHMAMLNNTSKCAVESGVLKIDCRKHIRKIYLKVINKARKHQRAT